MKTVEITVSETLRRINPAMALGIIECKAINSPHSPELWNEIREVTGIVRKSLTYDAIKDQPPIAATRRMYSLCGKDPSRYRPSAEALMRRIVKGQDLYRICTLVDLINLVSLKSGYSIGAFDVSFIEGPLEFGFGKPDEIYHAIGRGLMNIENLPVLRDVKGPVGTPTSDEERTSIRNETNHLLLVIYAFAGEAGLQECIVYAKELLTLHTGATDFNSRIV